MSNLDDDFTTTIKPNSNTVKAQKKKAEYKAKHRNKATYRNHDFFSNPDDLTTSCDEFNVRFVNQCCAVFKSNPPRQS
jgi:pyocin large subunit-like protein